MHLDFKSLFCVFFLRQNAVLSTGGDDIVQFMTH